VTDTQEINAETLTGEQVLAIRTANGMGRKDFALLCGYTGPSRITNIELHENWKRGDREKVAAGLVHLREHPPKGKSGRVKGQTGPERAAALDAKLRTRGLHVSGENDAVPTLYDVTTDIDEMLVSSDVGDAAPAERERNVADAVRDLTNSEVSVWQRCRRKWWLAVYRQLTLKQQDFMGPRAIGNRVHRALAAWYVPEGQERTDPREALERVIVEDWTSIASQARAHPSYVDDGQSLADLSARFNDSVSLERAMVEGYMEWVIERGDDANFRITAPETEMNAIIEGKVADDVVRFRSRALLDVRLTRVTDGVRLYEDHKTVGNLSDPRKTLHMDPQMLNYMLLEFLNTDDGEARCDGALYNMIRRVKRTAQAKPPFYERVEVHHNALEIDAYKRRLLGAARDIMRAESELEADADPMSVVYPNPTRNCSWDCEFFPICPMFDDGSRVEDAITALYRVHDPMARYDLARNTEEI
jgi:hypothetical protein